MKDANDHSIGAALRACAPQMQAGQQPVRPAPDAVAETPRAAPTVRLTQRQLEVLALLCEGLPNKLICRRLNIATGTVKVHISSILRELGVTSRVQAVVAAGSFGLTGENLAGTLDQAADKPVKASRSRGSTASGQIAVAA